MHLRRIFTGAVAVALFGFGWLAQPPAARAQAKKGGKAVTPDEKSFTSIDGVTLRGLFYKSVKGGSAPVVLLLHDYKANPEEAIWSDTAQTLVGKGYNVLRFDFRGHGKSTDIDPSKFWINPINRQGVRLTQGLNVATDNSIKYTDFSNNYFPMLVQDLAAARNLIDQLNDTGELNASTIYVIGAGESAALGMFFIATEWLREKSRPENFNTILPAQFQMVSTRRPLMSGYDPAGQDYGGAIWLGPNAPSSLNTGELQKVVISPYAVKMRNATPMLFVYGSKDTRSANQSKAMFNSVLKVNAKIGMRGQPLMRPEQTFLREIKGTGVSGVKLLGNKLGTEKMVQDFLAAVDKERKGKVRKNRDWNKPLYIDITSFGVGR